MALIVNGQEIPNGTVWQINGVDVQAVEVLSQGTWVQVWGSTEAPGTVDDFTASDDLYGEIRVNWTRTTGVPSPKYDLYQDGTVVATDITPGYTHEVTPGTYTYYLVAYNNTGNTQSNYEDGTALIRPSGNVTVHYGSAPTGDNPEVITTVSDDFYYFNKPEGVKSFTVCAIAGGGAGYTGNAQIGENLAGGGYAGKVISTTYDTPYEADSYALSIGKGGIASLGSGGDGSDTEVGVLVATGGKGATTTAYYQGQGLPRSNCAGNFYDGAKSDYPTYTSFGGQAGFSDGGAPQVSTQAGPGSGAGGNLSYGGVVSSDGGNGEVRLTW